MQKKRFVLPCSLTKQSRVIPPTFPELPEPKEQPYLGRFVYHELLVLFAVSADSLRTLREIIDMVHAEPAKIFRKER